MNFANMEGDSVTPEAVHELFEYRDGELYWRIRPSKSVYVGDMAGYVKSNGYREITVKGRPYLAHRLTWLHQNGAWPKNDIDHINQNKLDNRIENLRDVTHTENHKNRSQQRNNKSGYTGVYWSKSNHKWQAGVRYKGQLIHLGLFNDKEDAALMACSARSQLNFHDNHGGQYE